MAIPVGPMRAAGRPMVRVAGGLAVLDGSAVTNPFRIGDFNTVVDDRGRSISINKRIPAQFTSKWRDGQLVSAITVHVPGEKEPRHYEETISLVADGVLSVRIQKVGTGDSRTLYYKKQ